MRKSIIWVLLLLTFTSCSGYRRGIESRVSSELLDLTHVKHNSNAKFVGWGRYIGDELIFPGVTLYIDLNNSHQTHEGGVIVVIPIIYPSKNETTNYADQKHNVYINITPHEAGYVFDFRKCVLRINQDEFIATEVSSIYENSLNFNNKIPLDNVHNTYKFILSFDTDIPSPENNIAIDLSEALMHDKFPTIPPIQFKKNVWWYLYT